MTKTYIALANTTLTTTATSVTFSNIPTTYRDLVLINTYSLTAGGVGVRVNSDSGNNYNFVYMRGGASGAVVSAAGTNQNTIDPASGTGDPADSNAMSILNFIDYAVTNKNKMIFVRHNNAISTGGGHTQAQTVRWANNTNINSILIYSGGGSMKAGSSFALYGIVG
jgi:hypothetical protein